VCPSGSALPFCFTVLLHVGTGIRQAVSCFSREGTLLYVSGRKYLVPQVQVVIRKVPAVSGATCAGRHLYQAGSTLFHISTGFKQAVSLPQVWVGISQPVRALSLCYPVYKYRLVSGYTTEGTR
jgi:hypothetical protein